MEKKIIQKLTKNPDNFIYGETFSAYLQNLEQNHTLDTLPRNLYVYYVLSRLFGEVNNGGFSQFLCNSSCKLTGDLIVCAESLGIEELTVLIREFIAVVNGALSGKEPEEFEFGEEFDERFAEFDKRFYDISEKYNLEKALKKYYKDNLTEKSVSYTVVKEKESNKCKYFKYDITDVSLYAAVKAYLDFISDYKTIWNIEIVNKTFIAAADKDCVELSELMSSFIYELDKYGPVLAFDSFKVSAPISKNECADGVIEVNAVHINPSGFEDNEYSIKLKFEMGIPDGSIISDKPHTYVVISAPDAFDSERGVLDELLKQVGGYKNIKSVYSNNLIINGDKYEFKKEYYWKKPTLFHK